MARTVSRTKEANPYESTAITEVRVEGCGAELASPTGQQTTLADRLAEIAERYGAEHLVVRCLQRAHDHLASTEERMWAAGVRD